MQAIEALKSEVVSIDKRMEKHMSQIDARNQEASALSPLEARRHLVAFGPMVSKQPRSIAL